MTQPLPHPPPARKKTCHLFSGSLHQAMNAFERSQRRIQEDSKQTAKGMETGKKNAENWPRVSCSSDLCFLSGFLPNLPWDSNHHHGVPTIWESMFLVRFFLSHQTSKSNPSRFQRVVGFDQQMDATNHPFFGPT